MSEPLIFFFLKGGMCRHFDQKNLKGSSNVISKGVETKYPQ